MTRTRVCWMLALCAGLLVSVQGAGAQTLYSVSSRDANLRTIDPGTGMTLTTTPMTLTGQTINGANGLATHPSTGQLWVLLQLSMVAGRVLGTVDPSTGVVTSVGNTGDSFAGLAFDCAGNLYGVTGDGAAIPASFFSLDQTTAVATLLSALGNGDGGETIGFNPVDNLMYHASGFNTPIFESFDPTAMAPFTPTNIPIAAPLTDDEGLALTFEASTGNFLWGQLTFKPTSSAMPGPLFRVTTTGAATLIGNLDHVVKGLAYTTTGCIVPPVNATDFSIATTSPSTLVLTVKPGVPGTFMVRLTPIPAGSTFGAQVDVTCSTNPAVGTCTGGTVPAGTGQIDVPITVTPTIFGGVPPLGGSPLLWLWVAALAAGLIAVGVYGRRRVARLGYAVTLGTALLLVALGMLQSACAGSTGQKLQGPYQVTVTATSGGISHSTSATYNVSK